MSSNPRVKCSVDQCTHNMAGEYCTAAHIDIYNESMGDSTAGTSSETQCKSFHQRKTIGDMVGSLHNVNAGGLVTGALMSGTQITPAVKCFVNTCTHWDSGDYCYAGKIHVQGTNAGRTEDTDCDTFAPKRS